MSNLNQLYDILDASRIQFTSVQPSEWYEQNMVVPEGNSFPGPFRFSRTPFWVEPLNNAAPDSGIWQTTIMGGAQIGKTYSVLNPLLAYSISQNPGKILWLTGHSDLSEEAMESLDEVIDAAGLRHLIRSNSLRARNTKTGDTNRTKEFPFGKLTMGSATNRKLARQRDVKILLLDDIEAAKAFDKKTGSVDELWLKRTSAHAHHRKVYFISSPEDEQTSIIKKRFLMGDQRYYNVPCPCCGTMIVLNWSIQIDEKETAGIHWKTDNHNNVIPESVGYVCQSCAGFFTDAEKYEMNLAGSWVPTATATEIGHRSYQLSSLYAPPGMDDWAYYAAQYQNMLNEQNEEKQDYMLQTFNNTVLGLTHQKMGKKLSSTDLQIKNTGRYEVGIVPEQLSIKHGNGKIVMLTCGADMNGLEDDARLDYEVVAHTESGSTYSITHGSIGTFIPRENTLRVKEDREQWTYRFGTERSVWPELQKILDTLWPIDDTKDTIKIAITTLDTGYYKQYAYTFIESTNSIVKGVKGDGTDRFSKNDLDVHMYKPGKERSYLYIVNSNYTKDVLSGLMSLKYDPQLQAHQPAGFMNFPTPTADKYRYENYFSHFEAEHRILDGDTFVWKKLNTAVQNHLFDCRLYNMVARDLWVDLIAQAYKKKNYEWVDFVNDVMGRK